MHSKTYFEGLIPSKPPDYDGFAQTGMSKLPYGGKII